MLWQLKDNYYSIIRYSAVGKLSFLVGELPSVSMVGFETRWKHFVAMGKLNPKRGLIPPFRGGDISWYLPKKKKDNYYSYWINFIYMYEINK